MIIYITWKPHKSLELLYVCGYAAAILFLTVNLYLLAWMGYVIRRWEQRTKHVHSQGWSSCINIKTFKENTSLVLLCWCWFGSRQVKNTLMHQARNTQELRGSMTTLSTHKHLYLRKRNWFFIAQKWNCNIVSEAQVKFLDLWFVNRVFVLSFSSKSLSDGFKFIQSFCLTDQKRIRWNGGDKMWQDRQEFCAFSVLLEATRPPLYFTPRSTTVPSNLSVLAKTFSCLLSPLSYQQVCTDSPWGPGESHSGRKQSLECVALSASFCLACFPAIDEFGVNIFLKRKISCKTLEKMTDFWNALCCAAVPDIKYVILDVHHFWCLSWHKASLTKEGWRVGSTLVFFRQRRFTLGPISVAMVANGGDIPRRKCFCHGSCMNMYKKKKAKLIDFEDNGLYFYATKTVKMHLFASQMSVEWDFSKETVYYNWKHATSATIFNICSIGHLVWL